MVGTDNHEHDELDDNYNSIGSNEHSSIIIHKS